MDSPPLSTLPLELFFYILSFLEPHEYSDLPCTCRHALSLVDKSSTQPKPATQLLSNKDRTKVAPQSTSNCIESG